MLKFIGAIPAKTVIGRNEALNLLGGVVNDGPACEADICLWANAGDGWRVLATRRLELGSGEHRHLYFTMEPEMFSSARWGEVPDELELAIRDSEPSPGERGAAVFIE